MVQADLSGSLGVEIGCVAGETFTSRRISEVYESECAEDTEVQWSFLTYVAATPSDSNVQFRLRAADTEAELTSASYLDVATARSSPDTQVCSLAGPSPCPIDLFSALDTLRLSHEKFVELEVTLNPTSNGEQAATIQNWELTYSCPFNQ